jgi:SAM-dependent methyltransferase
MYTKTKLKFYDVFHKTTTVQKRIIKPNNFTYRIIIQVLNKYIGSKKGLRILDYGCGAGTLSFYLSSLNHFVVGIDASKKAVEIARKSAKALNLQDKSTFYTLEETNWKNSDYKFDFIICIEVIEHVLKDVQLIRDLRSKLKKSGTLILSTPSINAPLYRLGYSKKFDQRVGHIRRYDPEKLTSLISSSGFKNVELKKTEGILRNSLYLIPAFGKLIRFIRGPLSSIITLLDNITLKIFGESDLILIAQKV